MVAEFSEAQKLAVDYNLELLTSKEFLREIIRQEMYVDSEIDTYKELYCEVGFYFHPENGEIIEVTSDVMPSKYRAWGNTQYAILSNPDTKDYAYILNTKTDEKIPANFKKARFEIRYLSKTQSYELRKMEYLGARAPKAQEVIHESMIKFNEDQERISNKLCNRLKRFKRRLELAINPDRKTIFE